MALYSFVFQTSKFRLYALSMLLPCNYTSSWGVRDRITYCKRQTGQLFRNSSGQHCICSTIKVSKQRAIEPSIPQQYHLLPFGQIGEWQAENLRVPTTITHLQKSMGGGRSTQLIWPLSLTKENVLFHKSTQMSTLTVAK